ncbi:MAG TPA: hypothetical protein VM842_01515 [Nitrospira sp.]|nr:hypothetical protein [Nitrospira sp.]
MDCRRLLLVVGMSVALVSEASAETYIAGAIGVTLPLPASVRADENINYPNPPGPGQLFPASSSTIGLKESVAYGLKIGHYFSSLRWLGLETDVFNTTPHVMAGTIVIDTKSPTVGTFREAQSGVHLRFTTWAFSLLARYPGLHWQPYAGIGPAIFWGHASGTGLSCNNTCPGPSVDTSSVSPGWASQAGLRYVTDASIVWFGEWKYMSTTAHFDRVRSFSNIEVHYHAHLLLVGVGYQFN